MKKLLTLFAGLLLCLQLTAALRTQEEAMRIAASFRTDNQVAHLPAPHPQALTHCFTAKQASGQPAFYVFNRGEENGFVLISAEDRTRTVLGYSDAGHWDADNIPDALRAWMDIYSHDISRAAAEPANLSAPIKRAQAKKAQQYTPISPICQTLWGQRAPFNLWCPNYNGQHCVTGCVATAAAQIMKVHNYPTQGTGTSSYKWLSDTGDSITLSVDYGNTTYDWSHMLNDYNYSYGTAEEQEAVAILMHHCGVASEMSYGTGASGTSNNFMLRGMVEHFGYDPGVQVLIKDCMTDDDFVAGIVSELQQGRPVMFSARTVNNEGHAFVGDGVDANGLIHINWGWNGACDGYFQVSAMDPENQGTGGSVTNEAFTEQVLAYTHIRPMAGGSYNYNFVSDKVYPYKTTVDRSEQNWVALQMDLFNNLSILTLSGTSAALKVYDTNGNFLTYCDYDDWSYDGLQPGYFYYSNYAIGYVSDLPNGNYYVSPVVKINGQYYPVQVRGYTDYRCPMQVTTNTISFTEPEPDLNPEKAINAYDYTKLNAYYYPSYSGNNFHYWTLQLSTEDFYENNAEDQMLLYFAIYTSSANSVIGSFLNDNTALYNIYSYAAYKGNISSYESVTLEDAGLTIAYNSVSDAYTLSYFVVRNGTKYIGEAVLPMDKVWAGYGEAYGSYAKYDNITVDNTLYTGITVSQALEMVGANEIGWISAIPYIVEGEISSIVNTPAQIAQRGNCRLYISDGENNLYCYNAKWFNNQSFQTGHEIAVGGQAAIIGQLCNYDANTKEIGNCYFYDYNEPTGIEQTTDDKTSVQKFVRNGQIFILRNGKTYTMHGAIVNE